MAITGVSLFFNLIYLIPQIIILYACIRYVSKKSSNDGILMTIGTAVHLLISLFYQVIVPYLYSYDSYSNYYNYASILNVISFIGSCLFAAGLLMLINKFLRSGGVEDSNYSQY